MVCDHLSMEVGVDLSKGDFALSANLWERFLMLHTHHANTTLLSLVSFVFTQHQ